MKATDIILHEDIVGHKAKRAEFIRKTYGAQWNGEAPRKEARHGVGPDAANFEKVTKIGIPPEYPDKDDFGKFIEKVAETDPTQKGLYMAWIVNMCLRDPLNRTEDLYKLKDDLVAFEENKARIENKDINTYKSFQDVFDTVEPFANEVPEEESDEQKKLNELKSQIIIIYNGKEGWVRVPTTRESATWLGQNTRWCTAGRDSNQFDYYNKTDRMFVIYDRATKERFQLHLASDQFANAADRHVGIDKVPEWARSHIIEWYRKNVAKLSIRQMMKLRQIGAEGLEKGTPHEGVFALMQQYGVK